MHTVLSFSCSFLILFLSIMSSCSDNNSESSPAVTGIAANIPTIELLKVAGGFNNPVQITHASDGSKRIFVVEKKGLVKTFKDGVINPAVFLDLTSKVNAQGAEQGLLGIAFPPGFLTKRYFYANYTGVSGIGDTKIDRIPLEIGAETGNANASQNLLSIVQPFTNHNGGQLAFGPDGFLYIGLGDGGGAGDPFNNAQRLSTPLGKILRIDVEGGGAGYRIPTGNIFGNEIWSYGLRNPWRFSFDRERGDLYIADVGQNQFEEIHFQESSASGGQNYGWKIMEGAHCFNGENCNREGLILPVHEYVHAEGNCSVTGGYVYRGAQFPSLNGIYIYGDFCSGKIWGLRQLAASWENIQLLDTNYRIATFGEDEDGNIYLADFISGDIYQIVVP